MQLNERYLSSLIDITEGEKRQVRLKVYCGVTDKLEGTQYKLTTEMDPWGSDFWVPRTYVIT
jgi:hypothetical protein